jgi:hypothetical protein
VRAMVRCFRSRRSYRRRHSHHDQWYELRAISGKKMPHRKEDFNLKGSWPTLPLLGPCFGLFAILLVAGLHYTNPSAVEWSAAKHYFTACYASGIAVTLFLERYYPTDVYRKRLLEALASLVGFAVSALFFVTFATSLLWRDLNVAFYSAVAAAVVMIPRRTDTIRALALVLMAIAAIHQPLVSARPPFLSLTVLWTALGISCVLKDGISHSTIGRAFSVPSLACVLCATFGVYQVSVARETGSLLIFTFGATTIIFFGIGTAVIIVRGTWWERQRRRR